MKEQARSTEFLVDPVFDEDGVQLTSGIGVDGREYPDPVPTSPPVGYEPPSTLEALIESVIRRRDFRASLRDEFETPEEADDFDVDEDADERFPQTIFEEYFEAKSKRGKGQGRSVVSEKVAATSPKDGGKERTSEVPIRPKSLEVDDKPVDRVSGGEKSPRSEDA